MKRVIFAIVVLSGFALASCKKITRASAEKSERMIMETPLLILTVPIHLKIPVRVPKTDATTWKKRVLIFLEVTPESVISKISDYLTGERRNIFVLRRFFLEKAFSADCIFI